MPNRYQCNYVNNPQCIGGCNRDDRHKIAESDVCSITSSVFDGLPIRCVGEWAEQKIYLLTQYFGIFAQGMSIKWKGKINYIEICSGPGKCVNRSERTEFDGTALSIVNRDEFKYVNKALFFDINELVVSTLNQRLSSINAINANAFIGDYTNPETYTFDGNNNYQLHTYDALGNESHDYSGRYAIDLINKGTITINRTSAMSLIRSSS